MPPSPPSLEHTPGVALARPLPLLEAAVLLGGRFEGGDGARIERVVEAGRGARPGDLVLVAEPSWAARAASDAGWFLCGAAAAPRLPSDRIWVHEAPRWALAKLLAQHAAIPDASPPAVDDAAQLGTGVVLEPGVVVGPRSTLGPHVVLHSGVRIGADVCIGAGSVLGRPGFGWAPGPDGSLAEIPHLAGVVVEDRVTLGALCTVDAGTLHPTTIQQGTKIDSHVHVGHNVVIGPRCWIAAQCGFAGSVTIGAGVRVGGQAGFADHVSVGDGASIAAKSGVIGDVPPGATYAGYPAVPRVKWLRAMAHAMRASAVEANDEHIDDPGRDDGESP